jgi:cysteine desulfurase / selenocysteine lyase
MKMTPEYLSRVRELFPHTAQGKLYFNHAGTSPLSQSVVKAMTDYLERRSVGELETYMTDIGMVDGLRNKTARLINAPSGDRISFQPNTSDAVNVAAMGVPWKAGDHILVSGVEFPANVYPWLNVRSQGVTIDWLDAADGRITLDMISSRVTPKTRLVALSAVQFLSGYRADLKSIGEFLRSRKIIFAVDAIQALGAVRIDVQAMNIDFLAAGSQKWLMGPHGTGFIFLTEELQELMQQKNLGWLSVADPWNFHNYDQPLNPTARRYEGGSLNMPGLWGLDAALDMHLGFGPAETERHLLSICARLMEGLSALPGIRIHTPRSDEERAGIVTISVVDEAKTKAVFKKVMSGGMTIALRDGLMRYSPHYYNSADEMDQAVERTKVAANN